MAKCLYSIASRSRTAGRTCGILRWAAARRPARTAARAHIANCARQLGIDYDFTNARPALTINAPGIFDDFYLIDGEVDPGTLRCQPEEVSEARWAGHDEILSMIDDGIFIPYHKCFIDMLFAMHATGSMRSRPDTTVPREKQ